VGVCVCVGRGVLVDIFINEVSY